MVVNAGEVQSLLNSAQGLVAKDLLRRGQAVVNLARQGAPVDTGRLRSDISLELRHDSVPFVRIGNSVDYAIFVHEGTGIYGRSGRPIRPRRAKVLRFKAGGKVIYRPQTRGSRGRPYLRNALRAAAS